MKTASAPLIALLAANRQFIWAELYTITLINGTVLYYTSADQDITTGGHTYSSSAALFSREQIKTGLGLQVDNLTLTVLPNTQVPSLFTYAMQGYLDGSAITLQRLFMPTWGDFSITPLLLWQGLISDVKLGRSEISLTCVSAVEKLNIQLPRNIVRPSCGNTLFDALCTLNKASFAENLAVTAGGNNLVLHSASVKATGYYNLGQITFTSGANSGLTFSVRDYTSQIFTLNVQPPNPVANGDAFTAYPGCDKTSTTCTSKFNNLINIRAMEFVPSPETAA